jgi:glucosylceramidase
VYAFPTNMKITWNRRQFLQGAGSALAVGTAMPLRAAQQGANAGADAVTCVTTTAGLPWQVQTLAKPGWRWDALNLNVDLSATAQTMEGFGGASMSWGGLRSAS